MGCKKRNLSDVFNDVFEDMGEPINKRPSTICERCSQLVIPVVCVCPTVKYIIPCNDHGIQMANTYLYHLENLSIKQLRDKGFCVLNSIRIFKWFGSKSLI